jgi:elongation factor Ts
MQVASVMAETNEEFLDQEYIRDPSKKVGDLIKEAVLKFGENIKVVKFVRWSV